MDRGLLSWISEETQTHDNVSLNPCVELFCSIFVKIVLFSERLQINEKDAKNEWPASNFEKRNSPQYMMIGGELKEDWKRECETLKGSKIVIKRERERECVGFNAHEDLLQKTLTKVNTERLNVLVRVGFFNEKSLKHLQKKFLNYFLN